MKLESIKSFTLTFLVGVSLLLTFGLWTYEPNSDISSGQSLQNSIDIGGDVRSYKDIIEPSKVLFHTNDQHFGFVDQSAQHNLFKDIQSWTLYNFQLSQGKGSLTENRQVEIVFPAAIPMKVTASLLTFDQVNKIELPDWSFKRIIITFNQKKSILEIHFISENGQQRATATVNNSSNYDLLWAKMTQKSRLQEFAMFEKGSKPIYIPSQNVSIMKRKITVASIEQTKLVKALFRKPSRVSRSNGDYSDGTRGMRIQNEGQKMEYYNPINPDINPNKALINATELLGLSMDKINDHKGWTDDYRLVTMDLQTSKIQYRMYYDGYPAFSSTELAIIEQQFSNKELSKYNRSLIRLKRVLDSDEVTLPAGSVVIDYLETKYASSRDLGSVQAIQIGYECNYESDTSNIITLNPAWFIKIDNHWQSFKDLEPKKGGAQDAMESN